MHEWLSARMSEPDWSLWRSFAAVVPARCPPRPEARAEPADLGRHVEALERTLGVGAVRAHPQGLKPTETALQALRAGGAAPTGAGRGGDRWPGHDRRARGTVRITSSTVTSHYILPPLLATSAREFPPIAIELVPSDSVENLLLREADIAVRMFRPTQLELIARKLGEFPSSPAPTKAILPGAARRCAGRTHRHDLIGFDRSDLIITGAKAHGFRPEARRLPRPHRQPDRHVGADEGGARDRLRAGRPGRDTPGMVPLLPMLRPPPLEVWLTTHRELFTSRRIRAIYDRLAEGLTELPPTAEAPGQRHR